MGTVTPAPTHGVFAHLSPAKSGDTAVEVSPVSDTAEETAVSVESGAASDALLAWALSDPEAGDATTVDADTVVDECPEDAPEAEQAEPVAVQPDAAKVQIQRVHVARTPPANKVMQAALTTALAAAPEVAFKKTVRTPRIVAPDAVAASTVTETSQKPRKQVQPRVAVADSTPVAASVGTPHLPYKWSRRDHRQLCAAGNGDVSAPVVISVLNSQQFIKLQPGFARPVLTKHKLNGTLTAYLLAVDPQDGKRSIEYQLLGTNLPLGDLALSCDVSFKDDVLRFSVASVAIKDTTEADAAQVKVVQAQRLSDQPGRKPSPVVFANLVRGL